MYYVGLDLHKRYVTACALDSTGQVVATERRLPTAVEALLDFLGALGGAGVVAGGAVAAGDCRAAEKRMPTLAYIREDPTWGQEVWLSFSDLVPSKEPAFEVLGRGDLVLSFEPGPALPCFGVQEWILCRLFRVSRFEETGDAFNYWLDLVATLSGPPGAARYSVTRDDVLQADNWFPAPEPFFKPLPRTVWMWLRDTRGVPLPNE